MALSTSAPGWQSRRMPSDLSSYRGYRFPSEIISYAVWIYHRAPQQAVNDSRLGWFEAGS